jgi:hypothetical protein
MLRAATPSKCTDIGRRFKHETFDYRKYKLRERKHCFGINILDTGVAGFIERFGKLHRPAKCGLNFTIPLIETIRRVTLREVAVLKNT